MQKIKKSLQIDLGHSCNNNCVFCMDYGHSNHPKETPIDYYLNLLNKNSGNFDRLVFAHNEPTLNDYLPELIARAKQLKYPQIMLITNGRRLSYLSYLDGLIEKGLEILGISVHGENADLHDSLTQVPGSFEQTLSGIKNASLRRKENKLKHFTIHTAVIKSNCSHIAKIYSFLLKFDPDRIIYNFFKPKCEAKKYIKELMPSYSEFAKQLKEIATNYKQPKFHSPTLPFCILEELKEYIGGMESGHINLRGKLQANSDSEMHKLDVCEQCKYYYSCPGIMNGYTEIYSDSEFKPIC